METVKTQEIKSLLPYFLKHKNVWTNYDEEADILYIHFKKPNQANHSEMTEDEIILRYENDEIIGMTVLHASKR
jgi:uncharacterized protein YuzE